MIKYSLPRFNKIEVYAHLSKLFLEHKDWVQPDVCMNSVFDCFPDCKMNGGRAIFGERTEKREMNELFSLLNENNMVPRLTFTNMLAKVEWLDEPYTRRILEAAAEHNGEAIVFSHEIGQEIRKRYGMPLILSTSHVLETADEVNKALETYDIVVLNYNHHKDPAFLNAINCLKRTEVMVNETCQANCPNRKDHHMAVSKSQVTNRKLKLDCAFKNYKNKFSNEDVRDLATKYGIENFKIVGREKPSPEIIGDVVYYTVLPDFREEVMKDIEKKFYS